MTRKTIMEKITKVILVSLLLAGGQAVFAQGPQGQGINGQADASQTFEKNIKEMDELLDEAGRKKTTAARKEFVTVFTKAQEYITSDKLEKAKEPIEKLHKFPNQNKYEEARVHLIDYWYQGKLGNKEAENEAAAQLMAVGAGNVDGDAFAEAGIRLLKRQFNAKDFGGAIDTLAVLRNEPASILELSAIAPAVQKLDDIAASNQNIVQQIKADDKGVWRAKLLRRTFFMDKIKGEISSIDLNCDSKQTTLAYKADSVMSAPDAWGSCSIKVNAKPETTFDFTQLTSKP